MAMHGWWLCDLLQLSDVHSRSHTRLAPNTWLNASWRILGNICVTALHLFGGRSWQRCDLSKTMQWKRGSQICGGPTSRQPAGQPSLEKMVAFIYNPMYFVYNLMYFVYNLIICLLFVYYLLKGYFAKKPKLWVCERQCYAPSISEAPLLELDLNGQIMGK